LQLSFLVKENIISIENGDDGLPLVRVVNSKNADGNESAQAFCSIDVSFCEVSTECYVLMISILRISLQKMAKHYNLREPMLKRLLVNES